MLRFLQKGSRDKARFEMTIKMSFLWLEAKQGSPNICSQ